MRVDKIVSPARLFRGRWQRSGPPASYLWLLRLPYFLQRREAEGDDPFRFHYVSRFLRHEEIEVGFAAPPCPHHVRRRQRHQGSQFGGISPNMNRPFFQSGQKLLNQL